MKWTQEAFDPRPNWSKTLNFAETLAFVCEFWIEVNPVRDFCMLVKDGIAEDEWVSETYPLKILSG